MVWSRRGRCSAPLRIFEGGDNYAGAGGRNQVLPRCQEAHKERCRLARGVPAGFSFGAPTWSSVAHHLAAMPRKAQRLGKGSGGHALRAGAADDVVQGRRVLAHVSVVLDPFSIVVNRVQNVWDRRRAPS
jgi:hypothetical protein